MTEQPPGGSKGERVDVGSGAPVLRGRSQPRLAARVVLGALDRLPFPIGDHLCAAIFLGLALLQPGRIRKALQWAERHPRAGRSQLGLAAELCAFQGRVRARHALLGFRSPNDFRLHVRLVGTEHLPAGGALLLGLHIGLPAVGEALLVSGHDVVVLAGERHSRAWTSAQWTQVRERTLSFPLANDLASAGGLLFRARHTLLTGGKVYMTADGQGRPAFTLAVDGTSRVTVSAGWLTLRRGCRVPVLPVLSYLDDGYQVVEIHRPLPPVLADASRDDEACRAQLSALLTRFLERFPEQCCGPVFL